MDNVYGADSFIARVHPVHLTNADQRQHQTAADLGCDRVRL